jgi:Glycosyltransferase
MRILCITPWFPAVPGAQSGNFILDSVKALQAMGNTIKVVVAQPWHPSLGRWLHPDWGRPRLNPQAHAKNLGLEQVKYLSIPRNYLRTLSDFACEWRVGPAIRRIAVSFKPNVILAHTELIGRVAVTSGRATGIPVGVVLHGINTAPRLNTPTQLRAVGKALAAADRVILVGEPLREYFASIVGRTDHFRIVYNGFRMPPVEIRGKGASWGSPLRLISVSNLHEGKGIDLNLQALGRLYRDGWRNWVYTIVGDGRERSALEAIARDLGITAQVRFTGAVDHNMVYSYLAKADIFVLPSYREAFGVAYLEAMACGLLVIGVRGQGPEAFIHHHETGLLVEPKDLDSLVDCLRRLFEDPARMQAIAAKGRDFVRAEFTWQRHAEKMNRVLSEVAAGD